MRNNDQKNLGKAGQVRRAAPTTETETHSTLNGSHDLHWRVNTAGLFQEIIGNNATAILTRPLQITGHLLAQVANRAAQLNDPELNGLMCQLALYSVSDPNDKKNYRARITDKTIKAGATARERRQRASE